MNRWSENKKGTNWGQDWDNGRRSDGFGGGLLDGLPGGWQWEELAAEVGLESQTRVALVGLAGSGKSTLFNRLRGWRVASAQNPYAGATASGAHFVEAFGAFVLADLPAQERLSMVAGEELMISLGDPALIVYVLDGYQGVQDADGRWLAVLRACGKPLVVILNKIDLLETPVDSVTSAGHRLGIRVLGIAARTGQGVESHLLPAMLDAAPRLAVPLGREIVCMRRVAARRVIRRVMLLTGLMGAQPVPVVDLPFQVLVQTGLVMRIGAIYGTIPQGSFNREMAGSVAGALALNYLGQTLVKLVPVLGWAVSGALGAAAAWVIGEAAILYYEGIVMRAGEAVGQKVGWLARWPQRFARRLARTSSANGADAGMEEIPVTGGEEEFMVEIPVSVGE